MLLNLIKIDIIKNVRLNSSERHPGTHPLTDVGRLTFHRHLDEPRQVDEGEVRDIVCPDVDDGGPVADSVLTRQEHGRCRECAAGLV